MRPERLARVRAARYHRHGHPHHHCLILMAMVCLWDQGRRGARTQARRGPRTRARSLSLARHDIALPREYRPRQPPTPALPSNPRRTARSAKTAWVAGPGPPVTRTALHCDSTGASPAFDGGWCLPRPGGVPQKFAMMSWCPTKFLTEPPHQRGVHPVMAVGCQTGAVERGRHISTAGQWPEVPGGLRTPIKVA